MNILHIDTSILGEDSVTRGLSAKLVARLTADQPKISYTYRDLAANPVPHLSGAYLAAKAGGDAEQDVEISADIALGEDLLAEFMAADIVVLGVPMYNFGVPSQLKAWFDRVAVAGKTFKYTQSGPEGLVPDKIVYVASGRGSQYAENPAMVPRDHQEPYLSTIFGFFGIANVHFFRAEGVSIRPEGRSRAINAAEDQIAAINLVQAA